MGLKAFLQRSSPDDQQISEVSSSEPFFLLIASRSPRASFSIISWLPCSSCVPEDRQRTFGLRICAETGSLVGRWVHLLQFQAKTLLPSDAHIFHPSFVLFNKHVDHVREINKSKPPQTHSYWGAGEKNKKR